ncbi:MAG: hypothetical protein HY290_04150 [Planctomycetia bacterium]|nr:hypothetical protein [Planctomycetia bacterium]
MYFYRHDGIGEGELAGAVAAQFERADSHPSLTADGARCAYASKQIGGFTPLVVVAVPDSRIWLSTTGSRQRLSRWAE